MADKFKKQNRQKKDGGSISEAGQMNMCEGSWTPQVSSVKLSIGEEEDGRGRSAYQFSRKAT